MAKFNVGDRVEIIGMPRRNLIGQACESDNGQAISAKILGRANLGGAWYVLPDERRYRDKGYLGEHWVVFTEHLRHIDDASESTADEASDADYDAPTTTRFNVGDRVTIINANSEDRLVDYIVSETTKDKSVDRIDGKVVAIDEAGGGDPFYAVVPADEKYRCSWDSLGGWWCDDDDIVRADSTPTATPRRSSSRSKKATPDVQPLDPKRINVVQVDISKAIVGDDFPARPSQAFKDVMCELLIGEYERYGKSETDASS
jgi:hypothetical protein